MKKRAVVVCPGRGSYTKDTLNYLRNFGSHIADDIKRIDQWRKAMGDPTISALDSAEVFKPALHTRGEHASVLIYACALADFMAIDREQYDVVAICGNSMGWYLTLAFGGSLDASAAFRVVQTMGGMMREQIIGGQVIYPVTDEQWRRDEGKVALVQQALETIAGLDSGPLAFPSIHLGGYEVLGGNAEGVATLLKILPKIENYPFQLINHAAFHTPLLENVSARGFEELPLNLFAAPKVPLVDGSGRIWMPYSTDVEALWRYTLGEQVLAPYDFTLSVSVAIKEFAPDQLILLGPGNSLGGALGQIMIANNWHGLSSKADFTSRQERDPLLISMGRRLGTE